jgi:hypothetical protein
MHRRQFGQAFHALLACIREGRAPSEREIEQVAARIWHDAFGAITGLDWSDVEIGSWYERRTLAAARAACGVTSTAELAEAP